MDANSHLLGHKIGEVLLAKLIQSDMSVLHNSFVPAIEEACRDALHLGRNDITNGLVQGVLAAIDDREPEIRQSLELRLSLVGGNSDRCFLFMLRHLSQEVRRLKNRVKNRYVIEIGQLERQESKLRLSDEGSNNLNQRTQRGEFCQRVIDEIKRIKNQCVGTGRSVAEIQNDHPDFAVWKVRESLSSEDRDTFNHPNRWGPPVGFAKNILAKTSDVSVHTITSRVKAYRKSQQPKKQS